LARGAFARAGHALESCPAGGPRLWILGVSAADGAAGTGCSCREGRVPRRRSLVLVASVADWWNNGRTKSAAWSGTARHAIPVGHTERTNFGTIADGAGRFMGRQRAHRVSTGRPDGSHLMNRQPRSYTPVGRPAGAPKGS